MITPGWWAATSEQCGVRGGDLTPCPVHTCNDQVCMPLIEVSPRSCVKPVRRHLRRGLGYCRSFARRVARGCHLPSRRMDPLSAQAGDPGERRESGVGVVGVEPGLIEVSGAGQAEPLEDPSAATYRSRSSWGRGSRSRSGRSWRCSVCPRPRPWPGSVRGACAVRAPTSRPGECRRHEPGRQGGQGRRSAARQSANRARSAWMCSGCAP